MVTKHMLKKILYVMIEHDASFRYGRISESEKQMILADAMRYYFKDNSMYASGGQLDVYGLSDFICTFLDGDNYKPTEDGIYLSREDFKSMEAFKKLFLHVVNLEHDPAEKCKFLTTFHNSTNKKLLGYIYPLLLNESEEERFSGLTHCIIADIVSDLETLIMHYKNSNPPSSYEEEWINIYNAFLVMFKSQTKF